MNTATVKKKTKITKKDLLAFAFSFALGLSPITAGVYPLGLSLLIASGKHRVYIMLGNALAILFTGDGVFLPLVINIFVYYIIRLSEKEKPCPIYLKLIIATGCSILFSAKIYLGGIELFEDLVKLVFAAVSIPIFTALYSIYFDIRASAFPKALVDCSLVAFAFSGTLCFGLIKISDIPLSLVAGVIITMAASRAKGFLFGGVCGFFCGLACNVPAIAALGILGITYGLLEPSSPFLASALSFMLSISGYAYLSDFVVPAVTVGMFVAGLLLFIPIKKYIKKNENTAMPSVLTGSRDIKLKKFAAAFSALSGVFYSVSDTAVAESITEINKKINMTVSLFCNRCKGCSLDAYDICNHFTTEIKSNGIAEYGRLPLHFRQGCPNSNKITIAVNRLSLLSEERYETGLKALADEYNTFSVILNNVAKKQEYDCCEDKQLAEDIKRVLLQNKVTCDKVRVFGIRQKVIEAYGVKPDKMSISSNKLSQIMSETARLRISLPEFILNDNYVVMRMRTLPKIRVEYTKTIIAKNGEAVCGDTVSFFENDEKYFYCLLSDGMGSGRNAALTSRLSAIMLEKLLTIGTDKQDALQMVNRMLTRKKEEVFATIDLLEVDRITAQASIFKVGAAPTFLIRDSECHRIEAKTPPAGIMREVIAEKITVTLRRGDYIVMVSDGVVQTGAKTNLSPLIKQSKSLHTLASRILEEVKAENGCSDDKSVCVMKFY